MRMFFQNPFWLLGVLVAVPLLAHLFSKTRPRKQIFPSLKLLKEAMRRVTRIHRPHDRWLLLLRTLAVLALILAFLQPWLLSRFTSGSNASKTMVIVVDSTASMGFADGTRTRLAQATAAAEDVLSSLPSGSHANIVWVRARTGSALPEAGPNLDYLRQELRQAAARPEQGDGTSAIAQALKQLGAASGDRELVVISDFQKSAWSTVNWEMPPGVQLTRIAVGQEAATNLALAHLYLEPERPIAGQEARVVCRVRNLSADPKRATVFVEAGESRLTQTVEVAAWGETLAMMPVKFPQEGLVPLKATLSEDRFPGDDIRYGLAEVGGALQVVVAGGSENPTARTWARAARALEGVTVRQITPDQLQNPGRADVLLVANWQGNAGDILAAFLKGGGGLVVQPGENLDTAAIRKWIGLPEDATDQKLGYQMKDAPGWGLRIVNEENPIFAIFANGAFGDPANGRFLRRSATPGFVKAQPVLAFEDNQPALAPVDFKMDDGPSAGLMWWNLDLGASDWATRSTFVAFFGEFLRHVPRRISTGTLRVFEPGEPLRFDAGEAIDPADIKLVSDREEAVKVVPESTSTPQRLVSETESTPGSYRWTSREGMLDRAVVNFPEVESDLRQLNPTDLAQGGGTVVADGAKGKLGDMREGKPLWAWCLAAAALFFILEGICAWRLRAKAGVGVDARTEPSPTKA